MARSALTSGSVVLVMHAVFLVPSVVAVPCLRSASASEPAGQCIPGHQSQRNNNGRNEVSVQSPTDVTNDRVAVGYELISASHSLALPTIAKLATPMRVALFGRNGKRRSGKSMGATGASRSRYLAEYALPQPRSPLGHEPNRSHEPIRAEYALPLQHSLPSHELNRNSSRARYALAPAQPSASERAVAAVALPRAAHGDVAAAPPWAERGECSSCLQ